MKHPIRRRLMYLGFQGLRGLAQVLPLSAARLLGRALGRLAYALLRGQRRLTEDHLRLAFAQTLTPRAQRAIARRLFANLGQTAMEWLALPKLSSQALQRLIASEGVEHVRQALARGNGAILLTAHFGNWELIPLYLRSLGFEGGVLARRLRYPEYESFLIHARGSRGIHTFARGSLKDVAKVLRGNQIIGMLPDQDIDSLEGVFVDFFGRPAYTPVGPAALSVMTGAPIVPVFIVREGATFRLVIEPPIEPAQAQGADRAQLLTTLTQAWSRVVESYIRRFPDQWVWMHRRWKTQPTIAHSTKHTALSESSKVAQATQSHLVTRQGMPSIQPILPFLVLSAYGLVLASMFGCGSKVPPTGAEPPASATSAADPNATQQMSAFTLTGYQEDGSKRWQLNGEGASVTDNVVTVLHPNAVGFDPGRTAYLTASAAAVNQANRHVRLEHDVTIHTSDGLWLTAPVLHWIPDQNQVATDTPVRIETDHMLLRGREASGFTQLKHATIMRDIELVLNPSDHELPTAKGQQVTITCDGPLSFDYEHNIATFEQNVHVKDPNGDLYSDKLVAYLDQASHTIRYADATGHVRIHQNQNTALSERAVYEPAIGKITLVGKPSLLVYPSSGGQQTQLSFGGLRETSKEQR